MIRRISRRALLKMGAGAAALSHSARPDAASAQGTAQAQAQAAAPAAQASAATVNGRIVTLTSTVIRRAKERAGI